MDIDNKADVPFHSVTLDSGKCKGCINCIRRCPTEAIRVQNGKAKIISELCIDCGECIRVCPYHAKKAVYDPFEDIHKYKIKVALPAPALYGQMSNLLDIDYVLTALLDIGFDHVYEVSRAAELISDATRKLIAEGGLKSPVISSACPVIERLIRVRFPKLCENVLPLVSPMELAARMARHSAMSKFGVSDEDIGVFFITPCPAKVTDIKRPIGTAKSAVNGALAMSEIYPKLIKAMNKIEDPLMLTKSGVTGVSWASSGGEGAATLNEHYLAADGIQNVIKVLEEVEDDKLDNLSFIELNACSGGCVGGVLTVENPYVAKARIQVLRKYLPFSRNHIKDEIPEAMEWNAPLTPAPMMQLSDDMETSLRMAAEIDKLVDILPGIDCGSCGSPSCHALAEDIVRGKAKMLDCVYKLREHVNQVADKLRV